MADGPWSAWEIKDEKGNPVKFGFDGQPIVIEE
jgi:hypothetical protein